MPTATAALHRDLARQYPVFSHGLGNYLFTQSGEKYLDAVGGAAVVTIGHGVAQIYEALARNADRASYAYSDAFVNPWAEQLADEIAGFRDVGEGVYFVSGGSEATETAIKLARQYHVERGEPSRHKVISRWQSYHGVTLAALSVSGRTSWRSIYDPYMTDSPKIMPPYCYRCPFGLSYPSCGVACAEDLERTILLEGPNTVSAFIAEPISGTTLTGVTPVKEYFERVRSICDKYGILLIADEVLTGYGRTGTAYAMDQWSVLPDMTTLAKGIASGYAALGAVVIAGKVLEVFRAGSARLNHGFTYSALPASCLIGLEVLHYLREHDLFARAQEQGSYLHECLQELARHHDAIGEVRGRGLLAGVEFVSDSATREPFPESRNVSVTIARTMQHAGVLVRPGVAGANYGKGGDHLQISPPFTISHDETDRIVAALDEAIWHSV